MASTLKGVASYIENPSNYTHTFQGFTLCTTALDTQAWRNILTTVFLVLNFSIVLVGGSFLKQRNLFRLRMRHRKVAINDLTSWMTLKGALMYVRHTFWLPGGSAGFSLMILTGAFGLVQQYFVNSFILPTDMQTRCTFESGVVTTAYPDKTLGVPSPTFSAARTVYNAQYHVYLFGGVFGIYEKINDNYTNFMPAAEDVLGWWKCTPMPSTIISKTDWIDPGFVQSYVQKQDFLFNTNNFASSGDTLTKDGSYTGFLAWNSDQPDNSEQQWKVRASVATDLNGSDAPDGSTANVTNLECQLRAWAGSTWIPPILPSHRSLNTWADITFGSLMTLSSNYDFYIEWMLNTIYMVGGSGNNDQLKQSDLAPTVRFSPTYGCSVHGTQIKPEIWAILSVMLLLFSLLVVADILLRLYELFQRRAIAGGDLAKDPPSGVEHWQLLLLQAMKPDETIMLADMRDYSYSWDKDNKYVLAKDLDSAAPATASIAPATYRSYAKFYKEPDIINSL